MIESTYKAAVASMRKAGATVEMLDAFARDNGRDTSGGAEVRRYKDGRVSIRIGDMLCLPSKGFWSSWAGMTTEQRDETLARASVMEESK